MVGAALVRSPHVSLIAFTGSKEVGLDILRAAGQTMEEQGFVKKVVCEMGGKNAIVVDESADLDEAVLGVRQSAFGYGGQKCSACSRVLVVDAVYEVFLRRLVEATRSLVVGDPMHPGSDVGPVIDDGAAGKIREYIEIGKSEGKLELACEVPAGLEERVHKPYIGPHIFSGIRPEHRLAREEIFGPVLSVLRAGNFTQALEWANDSSFKLTGGVFSRRPMHLEKARRQFRVGNLYLNRAITGALVGRQPFGGFGLSGTGTQAGGPDYLLHFVEPLQFARTRCATDSPRDWKGKMKPLRVVLVTRWFWPVVDGPSRNMANLGAELANQHHAVTVVTARWGLRWPKETMHGDVRVVRLSPPPATSWRTIRWMQAAARWLAVRRNDFDLVYVSGLRQDAYAALRAAHGRLPVVLRAESAGLAGDCRWQCDATCGRRIRGAMPPGRRSCGAHANDRT